MMVDDVFGDDAEQDEKPKSKPKRATKTVQPRTKTVPQNEEEGRYEPLMPRECPLCGSRLGKSVYCVMVTTDGPIAYFKCPNKDSGECTFSYKQGRKWRPSEYAPQPSVAARPGMDQQ
jgi:hypothetical protein